MRDDIYYSILHLANCGVLIRYDPKKLPHFPSPFSVFFCRLEHNSSFGMIHAPIVSSGDFRCKALNIVYANRLSAPF